MGAGPQCTRELGVIRHGYGKVFNCQSVQGWKWLHMIKKLHNVAFISKTKILQISNSVRYFKSGSFLKIYLFLWNDVAIHAYMQPYRRCLCVCLHVWVLRRHTCKCPAVEWAEFLNGPITALMLPYVHTERVCVFLYLDTMEPSWLPGASWIFNIQQNGLASPLTLPSGQKTFAPIWYT